VSTSQPFRSPTGQIGPDAYRYEACQITNALRELDRRAMRLAAIMADELPADATARVSIASDRFPDATMTADRDSLVRMLPMLGSATDAYMLGEYARALASPEYVVRDRRFEPQS
jgi:hypothetical protein